MKPEHRTRWMLAALIVGGAGLLTALVVSRNGTPELTIPSGTRIVGALDQELSTERNKVGDRITISTTEPTEIASDARLPAGISLDGEITQIKEGGRLTGAPELSIRFDRLTLQGRRYSISAEPFRLRGRSSTPETAGEIRGGAASGAAIGTGVVVATEGDQIVLGAGRRLRAELSEPVTVRFRPEPAREDTTKQ